MKFHFVKYFYKFGVHSTCIHLLGHYISLSPSLIGKPYKKKKHPYSSPFSKQKQLKQLEKTAIHNGTKNSELATVTKSNIENFNQKLPKQRSIPSRKSMENKPVI